MAGKVYRHLFVPTESGEEPYVFVSKDDREHRSHLRVLKKHRQTVKVDLLCLTVLVDV